MTKRLSRGAETPSDEILNSNYIDLAQFFNRPEESVERHLARDHYVERTEAASLRDE